MECEWCGYEGERSLFKWVYSDDAFETRLCPQCGKGNNVDLTEVLEEKVNRAEEISKKVVKAMEDLEFDTVEKLLKELVMLNDTLHSEGLSRFIKNMRYKLISGD